MTYNNVPVGKIKLGQHKPHWESTVYEKPDTLHLEGIELEKSVQGGMDSQFALSLSDTYCMQIDTLKSASDIQALIHAAGKDYCERMQEVKNSAQKLGEPTQVPHCIYKIILL